MPTELNRDGGCCPREGGVAPAAWMAAEELEVQARLAWRNHPRCIGRLFWQGLDLLDARAAATADEVFDACVHHLVHSTHGGRIRPAITVFRAEDEPGRGIRIWNRQLIRYAGYRLASGEVLGDPEQEEFTRRVIGLGWTPPPVPGRFDVLPLVIGMPGQEPRLYQIPEEAVLEVPLKHPDFTWFADLGLKWHALPAVSDMALVVDGARFTAAPFSGFYMGTEIGSRNIGDAGRYNLMPEVARRMGLDFKSPHGLWKDRALVELNAAVIHSFREAGVTLVDHHTASEQFMRHLRQEEACGREVPGDWSWLVPPLSGSACPVFHRYYAGEVEGPSFERMPPPWPV